MIEAKLSRSIYRSTQSPSTTMAGSVASSADMANLADVDDNSEAGLSTVSRRSKRKLFEVGFEDHIDEDRVKEARKTVNHAMKVDQVALRLEYMVTKVFAKGNKQKSKDHIPPSTNKYHLLGVDRHLEIIASLDKRADLEKLAKLGKDDMATTVDFILALERPCAVPSKLMSVLKPQAAERYSEIGHDRIVKLKVVIKGDERFSYAEVNWSESGAFWRNLRRVRGAMMVVSLTHASGTTVALKPPVPDDFLIIDNHHDWKAKLVSKRSSNEVVIWKVFEKAGKLDVIPKYIGDTRGGQASSPSGSSKKPKDMLPIMDGAVEEHPVMTPSPTSRNRTLAPRSPPAGNGAGSAPQSKTKLRKVKK